MKWDILNDFQRNCEPDKENSFRPTHKKPACRGETSATMTSADDRKKPANASGNSEAGYPAAWSRETLRENWITYLEALLKDSKTVLPLKRILYQMEQNAVYQDTMARWEAMNETDRMDAWKKLIRSSEEVFKEVLPVCVQCGECCRKGSPALQVEDLDILKQGKIPWKELVTLRRGEPAHSPFEDKIFFLMDDRIKFRSRPGSTECIFLDSENDRCGIYSNRPVQCRAQACWDPAEANALAKQPYLTRKDLFSQVGVLMKILEEHHSRFSFEKLSDACERLRAGGEKTAEELLELLAQEDHYRHFFAEKFNIPEDNLELVFGRSLADLMPLFSMKVVTEPDGTRCLVPDEKTNA